MQPYVLVLAQTSHEAAKYVRRAGLPRGRWRIVARASSIAGIRQAQVHCLPGFHARPDKHSILAQLRYAKCEWIDVEMPLTDEEIAELAAIPWTIDERTLEVAYRYNRLLDLVDHAVARDEQPNTDEPVEDDWKAELEAMLEPEGWEPPATLNAEQILRLAAGESGAEVAPMDERPVDRTGQRRRKCPDCGVNHYKDEACPRTDGAEDAPTAPPVVFD